MHLKVCIQDSSFLVLSLRGLFLKLALQHHTIFIMFDFVGSITFDVSRSMCTIYKSHMTLFLAIFALWDSRIHIYSSNGCNVVFNVKTSVNKFFGFSSILGVPSIHSYNYYVQFWESFDNLRITG